MERDDTLYGLLELIERCEIVLLTGSTHSSTVNSDALYRYAECAYLFTPDERKTLNRVCRVLQDFQHYMAVAAKDLSQLSELWCKEFSRFNRELKFIIKHPGMVV